VPVFFIRNSPNSVVTSSDPASFRHPAIPRERHHGPAGYTDYASFRPWLRDEFSYRCVYCLIREQWGRVSGEFDLDHFVPQATDPALATDYDNLVYSCHRCNLRKADDAIPDPLRAFTSQTVSIRFDGILVGLTGEADRIIRKLFLNSPEMIRWRKMWIRICELAAEYDPDLFRQLFAYPDSIPNLDACRPPSNSRPEGIAASAFARRARGELPETYLE
jgi:hypothetical protein